MKLVADRITYRYGRGTVALREASLEVESNRIHGLVGPNGSGKTTLLSILTHQRRAQQGAVRVEGIAPEALRIGWASSEALLDEGLALGTFVRRYYGPFLGLSPEAADARGRELAARLRLDARDYERRPRTYSQGMRMKASLILALLENPDVVILDEPFNGLDVESVDALVEAITAQRDATGCAVLIADHQVDVLGQFADGFSTIAEGRIRPLGSTPDVIARYGSVRDAYRATLGGA